MRIRLAATLSLLLFSVIGWAQGLEPVESTAQNVFDTLETSSVVILAIAIFVAGILLIFRAASWGIIAAVLVGGVLLGFATEIAEWVTSA